MPWRHTAGSGKKVPFILILSTTWRWVVNIMCQLLYLQKKNPVSFEPEPGWAPGLLWTFGRRKSLLVLLRVEPWIVWPIAQTLYKLCHPIPSHYKWYMAISKKCLLKWTTFHLKLYASSVLDKFIQFVQGVTTQWSPASCKPNTMDGSFWRI